LYGRSCGCALYPSATLRPATSCRTMTGTRRTDPGASNPTSGTLKSCAGCRSGRCILAQSPRCRESTRPNSALDFLRHVHGDDQSNSLTVPVDGALAHFGAAACWSLKPETEWRSGVNSNCRYRFLNCQTKVVLYFATLRRVALMVRNSLPVCGYRRGRSRRAFSSCDMSNTATAPTTDGNPVWHRSFQRQT